MTAQEEFDQRYPLHAELKRRQAERMVVQKFLDWLSEQRYEICAQKITRFEDPTYTPIHSSKEQVIALFMGIDLDALRKENDRIYEELVFASRE